MTTLALPTKLQSVQVAGNNTPSAAPMPVLAGADKLSSSLGFQAGYIANGPRVGASQVLQLTDADGTLDPSHLVGGFIMMPSTAAARVYTFPSAEAVIRYITREQAKTNSLVLNYISSAGAARAPTVGACPILTFDCTIRTQAIAGSINLDITPTGVAATDGIVRLTPDLVNEATANIALSANTTYLLRFFIINTTVGASKIGFFML